MLPSLQRINLPGTGVDVAGSPTANTGAGTFAVAGATGESEHAARNAIPNQALAASAVPLIICMSGSSRDGSDHNWPQSTGRPRASHDRDMELRVTAYNRSRDT